MTERNLSTLSARTAIFCANDSLKLIISSAAHLLIKDILSAAFEDLAHEEDYLVLIRDIQQACNCSPETMSHTLDIIGFEFYDTHAPGLAHWVYQQALKIAPTQHARNNLAYISRYHRADLPCSAAELIDLLIDGVKQRDSFSLVNMALVFSQMLGSEDDWLVADRLIKLLQEEAPDMFSVQEWWSKLAEDFIPEGHLVLQWMNRHSKLPRPLSVFQTMGIEKLTSADNQIPKWIFEKYEKE